MSDIGKFYRETKCFRLRGDREQKLNLIGERLETLMEWIVQGLKHDSFCFREDGHYNIKDERFDWYPQLTIHIETMRDSVDRKFVAEVSAEGEWIDELPS